MAVLYAIMLNVNLCGSAAEPNDRFANRADRVGLVRLR